MLPLHPRVPPPPAPASERITTTSRLTPRSPPSRVLAYPVAVLGLLSATACGSPVPVEGMVIFVTETRQNAAFGGLDGADGLCAQQAADAGLDGEFKAWLSTMSDPVSDRLTRSPEPYVRVDGRLIAENWEDLLDGAIEAPIDLDASGARQTGDVWTGTLATGEFSPVGDCAGFTNAADGRAQCGDSESTTGAWTENITPACSISLRLYCVQQ